MSRLTLPLADRRATRRLARAVAQALAAGDLLVLEGPLGSGKTFFTRALCRALGLPEAEPVTSPTFTLVCEHETRLPLLHADLYRLASVEELEPLGLRARRDEGAVLVVEWGAPFTEALGGDALLLQLTPTPRSAALSASGARSTELLAQVKRSPWVR